MLNEIIIILFLSIITTAIMLSIAQFLKKIWNINHPKNNFFIYLIVLLTAVSIIPFSVIAFSASSSDAQTQETLLSDLQGVSISDSTIITKNQNITYSSTIQTITAKDKTVSSSNGLTKYLQKISWSELIILDEAVDKHTNNEQLSVISQKKVLNASQFIEKSLSFALTDNSQGPTPTKLNQILTNFVITQNEKQTNDIEPNPNKEVNNELINIEAKKPLFSDISEQSIFNFGMFVLFLISSFYVLASIFLGKKHTIKTLHAKPCENKKILKLVDTLSKEFHINTPKIYLYDGAPNAFVFGYPLTIAIAKQLYELLNEQEFEAAIRHEIAHIKNHDIFIKPFLQGLRIFFFYNPIVHYISHQIMKNREILADASTFQTKKQKIALMEALIKINETSVFSTKSVSISQPIALLSYNPAKLTLSERFSNLFSIASKKSALTLLVSFILLTTNLSIFFVAETIGNSATESNINEISNQTFSIDNAYYQESITLTKVEKDSKIYFAVIVHRDLYNYVSIQSTSSFLEDAFIENSQELPFLKESHDFQSF